MNLCRNFLMCPYLSGSNDGVMCSAASMFIRNISDINLDICMSKYYELCYVYCAKLQEISEVDIPLSHPGENQVGLPSIP
jgi:hypothetical protein